MNLLKKMILPVGLLVALIASIVDPYIGIVCKNNYGVEITVVLIFLISGYVHKFSELKFNKKFYLLVLLATFSNLVILPFIGYFIAVNLLSFNLAVGIIVITAMPPTLSSGIVITEVADGNTILAMLLTIVLNLLGLITIPIVLKIIFNNPNHHIEIDVWQLFFKLLFLIFIPFFLGRILKNYIKTDKAVQYVKLISPLSVVLAVWMCISVSISDIMSISILTILAVVLTVILIHVVFLLVSLTVAKSTNVSKEDIEAFIFVVSQKTMPLAILIMISILNDLTLGIISCVIYHFMQILVDSMLASFIAKRKNKKDVLKL